MMAREYQADKYAVSCMMGEKSYAITTINAIKEYYYKAYDNDPRYKDFL